jgi:hypothetical protein
MCVTSLHFPILSTIHLIGKELLAQEHRLNPFNFTLTWLEQHSESGCKLSFHKLCIRR